MGKVRDYVRSSKVSRAMVTTLGVGSFLALVATVTLWAASYVHFIGVKANVFADVRVGVNFVNGFLWFASYKDAEDATSLEVDVFPADSRNGMINTKMLARHPYRVDFRRFPSTLLGFTVRMWPLALIFALTFLAAFALSFRFTLRTLLVCSTLSCLLFGAIAMLIQHGNWSA